MQKGDFFPLF
jgi:hypothetical protein